MNNFYGGNDQNNSFSGTQIMSQQGGGGGGGFLNTSTMADMVGGGGGDTTDMGMGQEQQSFNVSEPCLLPCTIKQILNAPAPSQDETLKVDGKELNSVTIVGKIININVESTHVTYEIDDGTGQLDVSLWTAGSGNNDNSNNNNNSNNNRNDDFKSDLVNDCYVRCIGKIKTYKDNRSMTGYMIRRIEDFNEITYHNLEVLHTHLINIHGNRAKEILRNQNKYQNSSNSNDNNNNNSYQNNNNNNNNNYNGNNGNNGYNNRGNNNNNNNNNFNNFNNNNNNNNGFNNNNNNNSGSNSNNNNNNFNNGNFNNNNNNDNSFNNGGNNGNNNFSSNFNNNNNGNNNSMMVSNFNSSNNNGDAEGESALARKLLTFLQECEKNANENYDGCYVDRIFEALKDEDRNEVKELLEHLSSDGKIFTTVDEEHYRLS